MNAHCHTSVLSRLLLPASLLVMVACKNEPSQSSASTSTSTAQAAPETKSARISDSFTAGAEVIAIAAAERKLTLRREDGSLLELYADSSVRNFDNIMVGDTLRVRYQETLVATKMPAGTVAAPVEGAFAAARAKPGAKPGAGVGVLFSVRVRIESIDRERDIVTFSQASGELIARHVQTPEGRAFAAGLKVGDVVQLDYAEGLALAIEKL
jgi:hypothetical protein